MEGQPISVEALERPVDENRPPPYPVEGAGTGPMLADPAKRGVSSAGSGAGVRRHKRSGSTRSEEWRPGPAVRQSPTALRPTLPSTAAAAVTAAPLSALS